jgi:MYXO-CTERM domain-containing protein
LVGEEPVWQNLDSEDGTDSNTHHRDKEWRFHDVDLSEKLAGQSSGQVHFVLTSDQGLEMGGWTLDDVCLVALEAPPVDPCASTGAGGGCEGGSGSGAGDTGGSSSSGGDGTENQRDDGGCDCRSAGQSSERGGLSALAAIALAAAARRRRRSS